MIDNTSYEKVHDRLASKIRAFVESEIGRHLPASSNPAPTRVERKNWINHAPEDLVLALDAESSELDSEPMGGFFVTKIPRMWRSDYVLRLKKTLDGYEIELLNFPVDCRYAIVGCDIEGERVVADHDLDLGIRLPAGSSSQIAKVTGLSPVLRRITVMLNFFSGGDENNWGEFEGVWTPG